MPILLDDRIRDCNPKRQNCSELVETIAMTNPFEIEAGEYLVLINDEGQHSLWPATIVIPAGWLATGPRGQREACLAWINEHWENMRPLSLSRQIKGETHAHMPSQHG